MRRTRSTPTELSRRPGAVVVLVLVSLATLLCFAALSVDVGLMYNTRADLQRAADASALAGALILLDQNRLKSDADLMHVISNSRDQVGTIAGRNRNFNVDLSVASQDITVGYLRDPFDPNEVQDLSDPSRYNSVRVRVRRDAVQNGPLGLTFAWIFGTQSTDVTAAATAALMDGIEGYRVTDETGPAELLPLTVRDADWENLLDGTFTSGDNYSYDPDTGAVTPGSDGILEINLYPGRGDGQLPPGNFGTVDIGPPNNSTADLARQIRDGVSAGDLSYFGGELRLGPDGTLPLNGDTGLSAGIKNDLASIIGLPRAIPLFSSVSGPGNNATFTVTGWGGIRVMYVKLTGSMRSKKVIIQSAIVEDDAVITGPATGSSYFVYQPVQLVR